MNIPMINQSGFSSERLPESQRAILRAQAEVAQETGCRFINLHGFTTDKAEWYADTLHLNTTGYAAIAEYIAEKILEPIYGDANFDRKVKINPPSRRISGTHHGLYKTPLIAPTMLLITSIMPFTCFTYNLQYSVIILHIILFLI